MLTGYWKSYNVGVYCHEWRGLGHLDVGSLDCDLIYICLNECMLSLLFVSIFF